MMTRFPTVGHWLTIAASLAALSSCGGSTGKHASEPMAAAGASGAPSAEPAACPSDIPSPDQIAVTPRAVPNLELLALKFSNGIVADQEIYDRLVRDVKAIDELVPELAEVTYRSRSDGRSLILTVDATTFQAMKANSYDSWTCLNDAYVVTDISFSDFGQLSAFLKLKGTYNMRLLAEQYRVLPGVSLSEYETIGGDGPKLCVTQDNSTSHYLFDQASGDCPAGCIDHQYTHFTTSASGEVANLGEPTPEELRRFAGPSACD